MPAQLSFQTVLYLGVAGAVLLIVLAIGFRYASRIREEVREGVSFVDQAEMLAEFERARDAGEIDEEEFRRVRERLGLGDIPSSKRRRDDLIIPPDFPEPRPRP